MHTWVIKNMRTGKYVYGTDYRYCKRRQRTSHNMALTFESYYDANREYFHRKCGKAYKIVKMEMQETGIALNADASKRDIWV